MSARNPWDQLPPGHPASPPIPKPDHPDTARYRALRDVVTRALVVWLEVEDRGPPVTEEDWTRIGEELAKAGLPSEEPS